MSRVSFRTPLAQAALALLGAATLACGGEQQPAPAAAPNPRAAPAEPSSPPPPPAATPPATPQAEAPPSGAPATPPPSGGATAAVDGAGIYQTYCATCHGPTGHGDGPGAAALEPKPRNFSAGVFNFDPNGNGTKGEIEDIESVARDGAAKYGGSAMMVPWGAILNPQQLEAVAKHVKSLGGS